MDKHGRPATPADEEILRRNQAFVRDYVSGNETERNARLMQMTNEVLTMELTPHMLDDPKYVLENAAKMKMMSGRLTYFENIMKDNRAYFDTLAPETLEKINDKLQLMSSFGLTLTAIMSANCVRFDNGQYTGDRTDEADMRADQAQNAIGYRNQFREDCANYLVRQERLNSFYTPKQIQQQKEYYEKNYGIYFKNGALDSQYDALKVVRDRIANYPDKYSANKDMIDRIYKEYTRALEVNGEAVVRGLDYNQIAGAHRDAQDPNGKELYAAARQLEERYSNEANTLNDYAATVEELLLGLLGAGEMSDAAKTLLEHFQTEQKQEEEQKQAEEQQRAYTEKQAAKKKIQDEKDRIELEHIAAYQQLEKERQEKEAAARKELSQHLHGLQHWNKDEDREKVRASVLAFQRDYDKKELPQQEQRSAPAAPDLAPLPAESKSTLRRREKLAKNAAGQVKEVYESFLLSIPEEIKKDPQGQKFDQRSAWFSDTFHLDRNGQPAQDVDRFIQQRNMQRIRDYASGDENLRKPILDRMVQQYMNIQIAPDELLDQDAVLSNLPYYKKLVQLQLGMTTMQNENPEYFKKMAPALREEIERKKAFLSAADLNDTVTALCKMNGVDVNKGSFTEDPDERAEFIDVYRMGMARQHGAVAAYQAETDARRISAEKRVEDAKFDERLHKQFGVSFPEGATPLQYEDMQTFRHMIEKNPEQYAANREAVDAAFSRLYRTLSLMSSVNARMAGYQAICDENGTEEPARGSFEEMRRDYASAALDLLQEETTSLGHYATGLRELLQHLLTDQPQTELARKIRDDLGGQKN